MRIYAAVGALLGWFALVLQLYLMLVQSPAGALEMVAGGDHLLQLLHHPDQLLAALVFTAAFARRKGMGAVLPPSIGTGGHGGYIAIVGIVYRLLLRQLWNPQGMQWVADVLLHDVIPAGYVLYWLLFAPQPGCAGRMP
jgi:hypothetical protein